MGIARLHPKNFLQPQTLGPQTEADNLAIAEGLTTGPWTQALRGLLGQISLNPLLFRSRIPFPDLDNLLCLSVQWTLPHLRAVLVVYWYLLCLWSDSCLWGTYSLVVEIRATWLKAVIKHGRDSYGQIRVKSSVKTQASESTLFLPVLRHGEPGLDEPAEGKGACAHLHCSPPGKGGAGSL